MRRKIIAAFIIAASATLALASCGQDVPRAESTPDDAAVTTIAGDTEPTTTEDDAETTTTTKKKTEKTETTEEKTTTTTTKATAYVAGENGPVGNPNTTKNSNGAGGTSATTGVKPTGVNLSYYTAEIVVGQTKKYPDVYAEISELWSSSDPKVATVDSIGNITAVGAGECVIRVVSADDRTLGAEVKVTVKELSAGTQVVDGITYVQGILIANKSYALPASYNPGGLTAETSAAFNALVAGAANDGVSIWNVSGFRSYEYQNMLYNNYVASDGQAAADTYSARAGHSEHQTGLALDCNDASDNFIGTAAAYWLAEHCTEYGFIIRYPQGKQGVTGYKYEPWHIRYVGVETAAKIKAAAAAAGDPTLTLEEYLGIDSYYH